MSVTRRGKIAPFVVTFVAIMGLFYPAMEYVDLVEMGGHDGFASPQMMLDHGAPPVGTDRPTAVYLMFAAWYVSWLLSSVSARDCSSC